MRLIEAEELINILEWNKGQDRDALVSIDSLIKLVKARPTAYDVDKVVEQLKNNTYNMEICEEIPSKRKDIATFVDKEYKMVKLDDAIEIVKGGGIDGR